MAFADKFEVACALDSLSWVPLRHEVRVAKLACRFLNEEPKLKKLRSRKHDWDVTPGVLKPWIMSIYEPPRGTLASTIDDLMKEISRQRAIRERRSANRPWTWEEKGFSARRSAISTTLYGIVRKSHDGKTKETVPNCLVDLTSIGDVLLAVDATSEGNVRVYMRHRPSGRVKVVITKMTASYRSRDWTLTKVLLRLAPTTVERALFGGHLISLNFDQCGFDIDGTFHPWQNVAKVVEGPVRALRTPYTVAGDEE